MVEHPQIIIVPVVFLTFYSMLKIFFEYRLKRSLVEKGLVKEGQLLVAAAPGFQPLVSVKWGLVLIGIGLAVLLGQLFPREISETAMMGMIFLFAGVGFLVFYAMAKRHEAAHPDGSGYGSIDKTAIIDKLQETD